MTDAPRRVLFVTGKLAAPALQRVLAGMAPPFACDVAVLNITVAALMTTEWIASHLVIGADRPDLVLLPGLSPGEPRLVADRIGVRTEKGPKDLREIPRYFDPRGGRKAPPDYGAWTIEIAAEINDAARLTPAEIRRAAADFHRSGADIIDIGCTPGTPFPALGDVVRGLRADGFRVSIDSFDRGEIASAVAAGAELVLSVNGSNRDVVEDLVGSGARAVAIPDLGGGLDTLDPTLDALAARGVPYLIDPILEPIGFGFMASLERYAAVRRRHPDAAMLMGIGNLTELTAADSTGVNAILVAVCEELRVTTVLTTEVIGWARGAVREIDIARRLMHHAVAGRTIPKGIDDRLITTRDAEVLAFSEAELRALQAQLTDPNYRIFTDRETITIFNHERFVRGTDIEAIFAELAVDEATHAFYLGRELARASLAVALGKTYRQEGALSWGYLTPADDDRHDRVRLTQRSTPRSER